MRQSSLSLGSATYSALRLCCHHINSYLSIFESGRSYHAPESRASSPLKGATPSPSFANIQSGPIASLLLTRFPNIIGCATGLTDITLWLYVDYFWEAKCARPFCAFSWSTFHCPICRVYPRQETINLILYTSNTKSLRSY